MTGLWQIVFFDFMGGAVRLDPGPWHASEQAARRWFEWFTLQPMYAKSVGLRRCEAGKYVWLESPLRKHKGAKTSTGISEADRQLAEALTSMA